MCTSISFTRPVLFGRNLDLEVSFGQQVAAAPRELEFRFHHRPPMTRHLAMLGMANIAGDTPLYAEAFNEAGLYMAGLNFPGNAYYFPDTLDTPQAVAPYELIPLVLGSCSTLAQARELLETLRITAIPFAPGYPLAPLHWHIADATGSLTAEPTQDGLMIYEDPLGVLTNNPPFPFQMMNLNNYLNLSPSQPGNDFAPQLNLAPYGQGMGAMGLPGDFSPMSRFVRAAFLKSHAAFGQDRVGNLLQFFHILDSVAMVRGAVITPEGKPDETIYSCCIDPVEKVYYYKTYDGAAVQGVALTETLCQGTAPHVFPLRTEKEIPLANPS